MFITWLRFVTLLATVECGDLCSAAAIRGYAKLNAAASLTRHANERAAFIVRRPSDGSLTLVMWHAGDAAEASWSGRIPAGTIAIAHTHPPSTPDPSRKDVQESARLRIPIVVITPRRVTIVEIDGTPREVLGDGWTRRAR